MSLPGSRTWWVETALIAASGLALGVLLWDGPLWVRGPAVETATDAPLEIQARTPTTLSELIEAGCLTGENLRAMREGEQVFIECPPSATEPTGPPEDRLFP